MSFRDLPGTTICRFAPGDYLMRVGDPMAYVYYLEEGVVNREILTVTGMVVIGDVKMGGQGVASIIGLLTIFARTFDGVCHDDFVAGTACCCIRIPVGVCKAHIRAHPELMEEALVASIDYYGQAEAEYLKIGELTAPQQVCDFLLRYSRERDGGCFLPKVYNNGEITKFLGLHSVTVSRILNALRNEGVIAKTPMGWQILDREQLRSYRREEKKMVYDHKPST